MKQNIKVLIADDHPLFSSGISVLLQSHPQYKVVAVLEHGNEIMKTIEETSPDILMLDINMPGLNGLEVSKLVKKQYPHIKIILVTMYSPHDIGFDYHGGLADAYVLKDSGSSVFLNALKEVAEGRQYIDPTITAPNNHGSDGFVNRLKLSSREKEILQLIIDGLSNKEIAARLYLSELTIKTHRKNIMSKMQARNLAELLRKSA
jgi:DNA-binding NarL/FixJ family response regulator